MQFFTAATLAFLTSSYQLVAAFNPQTDPCSPEAHIYKGSESPGFIECKPTVTARLLLFTCGDKVNLAFDRGANHVSLNYPKLPQFTHRTIYGICERGVGTNKRQIAHVSISSPVAANQVVAHTFNGFNRQCDLNVLDTSLYFGYYELTDAQLQQCYKSPLKPLFG